MFPRRTLRLAGVICAVSLASAAVAQTPPSPAMAACRPCHTLEKGGRNGVGPNLYGVFGRPAASVAGFNYSPAMKASRLKWDEKTLDEYLTAPGKRVPGSRMPIGVTDPARRRAVIDYLKTAG